MSQQTSIDIAIVGAGPYGISLATALKGNDASFTLFGRPMDTWLNHMPRGMSLKSEGFASSIYDASGNSLASYCARHGLPFQRDGLPVPIETFCNHGLEVHASLAGSTDESYVSLVSKSDGGFVLGLSDGRSIHAKRVVLAVGIEHFASIPDSFANLPSDLVTHSSSHPDPTAFKDGKVLVVGAGASGIDLATLIAQAGGDATLVTHYADVEFNRAVRPSSRELLEKIRRPDSCMGPGVRAYFYEHAPIAFRGLPEDVRYKIFKTFAGPCGGWYIEKAFRQQVRAIVDSRVSSVEPTNGRLSVNITSSQGQVTTEMFDYLILATGYRPDVSRLQFLEDSLRESIDEVRGAPVLSPTYESSVPGIFFVGLASAPTFGPLMRFVCGTGYATKRLSKHLLE